MVTAKPLCLREPTAKLPGFDIKIELSPKKELNLAIGWKLEHFETSIKDMDTFAPLYNDFLFATRFYFDLLAQIKAVPHSYKDMPRYMTEIYASWMIWTLFPMVNGTLDMKGNLAKYAENSEALLKDMLGVLEALDSVQWNGGILNYMASSNESTNLAKANRRKKMAIRKFQIDLFYLLNIVPIIKAMKATMGDPLWTGHYKYLGKTNVDFESWTSAAFTGDYTSGTSSEVPFFFISPQTIKKAPILEFCTPSYANSLLLKPRVWHRIEKNAINSSPIVIGHDHIIPEIPTDAMHPLVYNTVGGMGINEILIRKPVVRESNVYQVDPLTGVGEEVSEDLERKIMVLYLNTDLLTAAILNAKILKSNTFPIVFMTLFDKTIAKLYLSEPIQSGFSNILKLSNQDFDWRPEMFDLRYGHYRGLVSPNVGSPLETSSWGANTINVPIVALPAPANGDDGITYMQYPQGDVEVQVARLNGLKMPETYKQAAIAAIRAQAKKQKKTTTKTRSKGLLTLIESEVTSGSG
jgi:hypothetical protein